MLNWDFLCPRSHQFPPKWVFYCALGLKSSPDLLLKISISLPSSFSGLNFDERRFQNGKFPSRMSVFPGSQLPGSFMDWLHFRPSVPRRSGSPASTAPGTVLPWGRSSRRWRSLSTRSTSAASAERRPWRGRLSVSGSKSYELMSRLILHKRPFYVQIYHSKPFWWHGLRHWSQLTT